MAITVTGPRFVVKTCDAATPPHRLQRGILVFYTRRMDYIFILETGSSRYRYNRKLKARTLFINDRRLGLYPFHNEGETPEQEAEDALWDAQMNAEPYKGDEWARQGDLLAEYLRQEPIKTLVVMDYCTGLGWLFRHLLKNATNVRQDDCQEIHDKMETPIPCLNDRWLILSFFHNDEDTCSMIACCSPEKLIASKIQYLTEMLEFPFIRTVEIPYDFDLTEECLRDLFEQYVLGKSGA
ncbi:MAG: hypothetical protein LBS82_05235 [Spirochaetaceae bacterium]|jgi:hypothetical protein|nr:hypothetical protein [Spirochaetaceae bacterium]